MVYCSQPYDMWFHAQFVQKILKGLYSTFEDKLFMDGQVRTWVKAIQVQSSTLLSTLPPSPRPPILPLTRAMHLSLVAVPPGCSQSQLCVKMKKESYSFKAGRILISS